MSYANADASTRTSIMTQSFSEFDWRWKAFNQLRATEVYDMLGARSTVFVVEQKCVYADIGGQEADAWHLLASVAQALAGYLRVLLPHHPDASETDIRIGRVLTTAQFRGIGLGQ